LVVGASSLGLLARSECGAIEPTSVGESRGVGMRCSRWIVGMVLPASLTTGCALLIGIDDFPSGETTGTGSEASGSSSASGGGQGGGGQTSCFEVNGCRMADIPSAYDVSSDPIQKLFIYIEEDAGSPYINAPCRIVSSNDIFITINTTACSLHGGVSDGIAGTPDNEAVNPIEKRINQGADLSMPFKASNCVVPFYCADHPSIRGAIFHK
jgi:hypothetical protein